MNKKEVLIFGASSGLGKEIAKIFLKKGHRVTGLASTKKKSKELFEEINSESFKSSYCDLKKETDINRIKNILRKKNKDIELLVFSSSTLTVSKFSNMPDSIFENDLKINALSFINIFKFFMKLKKNKNINAIVILSNLSIIGIKNFSSYSISKSILQSFCESIMSELKDSHIMAVFPGPMATDFDKKAKVFNKSINYKLQRKKQSPKVVAEKIFENYLKKKKFLYLNVSTKLLMFLKAISTNLLISLINWIYK